MSLAFLAKKSWHTSNLRNVEKVWIAEQKHAAEEKKLAELKKNLEEERQMQELRKLQAAHGNKSATVERLDWMYQGPMASSSANERTAEEYLLGKEYKAEETVSDARKLGDSAYGALALTKAALPSNDAFSRLNEDPMMLIRSQQKRAQEDILKNPVKMKKIKGEVEKILKDKKEKKKAKKAKKKERKHGKSAKTSRSRSASMDSVRSDRSNKPAHHKERDERRTQYDSSSPRHHDNHGRSRGESRRTRSPERTDRPRDRKRYSRSPEPERRRERSSRSRSRSRGRRARRDSSRDRHSSRHASVRSPDRQRSRSRDRARTERLRRSVSRDSFGRDPTPSLRQVSKRDRSPMRDGAHKTHRRSRRTSESPKRRSGSDDYDRRHEREQNEEEKRAGSDSRTSESRDAGRRRSRSNGRRERQPRRSKSPASREYAVKKPDDGGKYGLIHREGAVEAKDIDRTTLGPNTKFLEKARDKKRQEEEELRQKLSKPSRSGTTMSREEMMKEAERMAEDAKAREAYLVKQATEKREKLEAAEAKLRDDPHFLKKLQDDAYVKGDSSMADRIHRNSHYIQKRAGAGNFLSKD